MENPPRHIPFTTLPGVQIPGKVEWLKSNSLVIKGNVDSSVVDDYCLINEGRYRR